MDLLTYISDVDRKQALAAALATSPGYLWQIATGWRGRRPSADFAKAIERETAILGPEGVSKESLRPDLWECPSLSRVAAGDEHQDRDYVPGPAAGEGAQCFEAQGVAVHRVHAAQSHGLARRDA